MTPSPSQPFFLYARKSTDVEDKQILSIEAQLVELREYAARENILIVEELVEKQSAKIPGRPIFNEMMSRIEKGDASGIVSWHPDRLARNSVDGGKLIYLVDTEKLTALKFPTFWFEPSPQGKFMLQIAFGQSKYYVDSLSENTKRGLRQKVRNGIFPAPAPLGYLNDVRTKSIIIDPQKGPILKNAFQLYAKGHSRLEDIAHFLQSKGLVSRKNNPYHKDRITYVLSNPFYIGLFRYGGEIHEGKHEPLITKKLFAKVQDVLKERGKTVVKTDTPKAFTGLLRCGICDMMITAEHKKKFYKGTNRHVTYIYYHCTRKSKTRVCRDLPIREENLDRQLSRVLLTVSLPPDWATKMKKHMHKDSIESAQSVAPIVAEKQQEILSITMKLQRLLDSYLDQDVDKETYRKKKQDFIVKKQTLEESIMTLQQSKNAWLGPMKTWISDASDVASVARGNDLQQKKEYLKKAFGSNLRLTRQTARGDAREPWAALRAAPTSRNWVGGIGLEPETFSMSMKRPACQRLSAAMAGKVYQLVVDLRGFEPLTFAMSMQRSNQLSYKSMLTPFIISRRLTVWVELNGQSPLFLIFYRALLSSSRLWS